MVREGRVSEDDIIEHRQSTGAMCGQKVRVLIVHPHRLFREALSVALGKCRSVFQIIGCVRDAHGLLSARTPPSCDPHVILVGSGDDGISLLQQIEHLRQQYRQSAIVVLTDRSFKDLVQSIAASLIRHRLQGETVPLVPAPLTVVSAKGLTNREQEVYRLRAQVLNNKEVAVALHIGVQTVKNHMRTIALKLQMTRQTFPKPGTLVSSKVPV